MPGSPAGQFFLRHAQVQPPPLHVQFDRVAVPYQRKRTADGGLRAAVEHDRAVRRAAHPRIGHADHVHDALFGQVGRNGKRTGFRHAHGHGTGVPHDQDVVGSESQAGIVDPRRHVVGRLEHGGRPPVPLPVR